MTAAQGQALRSEGQAQATHAADPRVVLTIDALITRYNFTHTPWSANDIRAMLPVSSSPLVGARVDAARKRGEMVAIGWVRSTLASTRGKPVVLWVGKAAP